MERTLTIPEFQRAYKLGRTKVYQQIESGRLKAVKIGKKTIIRVDDAEKWLAALKPIELNEETRARAVSRHKPGGSKSRYRP